MKFDIKNMLKLTASVTLLGGSVTAENTSAEDLIKNELVLKEQYKAEAELAAQDGLKLEATKKYKEAIQSYRLARTKLLMLGGTDEDIKSQISVVDSKLGQLYLDWSKNQYDKASKEKNLELLEAAQKNLESALVTDKALASKVNEQLKYLEKTRNELKYVIGVNKERIDKDSVEKETELAAYLEQAEILFANRRYYDARESLSTVLTKDPYNAKATRLLVKLNKELLASGYERLKLTREERLSEITWKWQEGIRGDGSSQATTNYQSGDLPNSDSQSLIAEKLKLIVPSIKFNKATIEQVIEQLRKVSKRLSEDGEAVSFVYKQAELKEQAPKEELEENLEEDELDEENLEETESNAVIQKLVTMELDEVPLGEIIRIVTEATGLKYKIDEFAVVIADESVQIEYTETRTYPVSSNFLDTVESSSPGQSVDVEGFLKSLGVRFASGSKAQFIKTTNRLVVTNDLPNLSRLEKVLKGMNVQPVQVTIEAKFVEINETDLEEIGFNWLLNDTQGFGGIRARRNAGIDSTGVRQNTTDARTATGANLSASENESLLTYGLRTFTNTTGTPLFANNLALDLVLGGIEFQTLIKAVKRKGSADVLSAPKVTTKSGKTAKIRVVTERFLPESYDQPEVDFQAGGGGGTSTATTRLTVTPPVPQFSDEPKELGVSLEVTPTVDPDGYTINLELKPEVLELIGFDEEFNETLRVPSTQIVDDPTGLGFGFQVVNILTTVPFVYKMPIIEARTVETTVKVWDGETVSIGGITREREESFKSKVPGLGDVPYLGRLFRSEGVTTEKRNLLIFVTARLITPAGLAIRPSKISGLPDFKR